MWCEKIFWCFIGHFLVFCWITSLAHGSALKGSEPLYLHVGSSDADSEMGYLKNMKDDGKKGYEHFESFHNKDGDDYGYEKHEAFGYEDSKDSKDSKDEETKADLKENPIVVQDTEEENQVEDYKVEKKEDPESENHQKNEEHQDIKVEPVSEVQQAEEEHTEGDQDHHGDPEEEEELTKIDRSDDHVEEITEENSVGVEDHQELKEEEQIKEQDPEKTTEEPPKEDYSEDYQSEDPEEEDYTDEDKKKTTRNANQDEEEVHEIYVSEPEDAQSTKKTYEVTESAEIVEGDQTQQLRYPYGFYNHLSNAAIVQNPYFTTEATPKSALHTRVNYGFYSPHSGLQKPQPTRPLAPTFSPKLSPLVKPRKNLGAFGYETMIYHHPGSSPNRQAIQIKIYDGEITVPATNVKAEEEETPKNAVDYDDEESEEEEESAEVEDEKRQNLRQEEDYDSEEDSGSSEESVERKPSGKYQNDQTSDDSSSGEEDDSDDLQSQLVTTSDVDNDAYYWL